MARVSGTNADLWQGMADSPLSPLGYEQAASTAELLARLNIEFGSVWSSDLSRAHRTAVVIADALGLPGVLTDPRLREAHAGEWQGLTHADIRRDWPGYLEAQRRPPDFELYESVVARGLEALHAIATDPARTSGVVVVVTHSGLIRSLLRHLDGIDPRIPNLGGAWIDVTLNAAGDVTSDFGFVSGAVVDMFDPAASSASSGAVFDSGSADVLGEEPGAPTL